MDFEKEPQQETENKNGRFVEFLNAIGPIIALIGLLAMIIIPTLNLIIGDEKNREFQIETTNQLYNAIQIGMTVEEVDMLMFGESGDIIERPRLDVIYMERPIGKWIEEEEDTPKGLQTTYGYLTERTLESKTMFGKESVTPSISLYVGFTNGVVTKKERE